MIWEQNIEKLSEEEAGHHHSPGAMINREYLIGTDLDCFMRSRGFRIGWFEYEALCGRTGLSDL
jgi:hypothetical protein